MQLQTKLTDSSGQGSSFYCTRFDPESENVRKESKLSVRDRNIELAVATTPGIPEVSIRKKPKLSGGFAQLAKKGTIRFTSYEEMKE